jgi:methylated-DNA-[protein]-cysteine S-methyltransferase
MTTSSCYSLLDSPVGEIYLEGDGHFVTGLYMQEHKHWRGRDPACRRSDGSFDFVREQLMEYFAGGRQTFEVPLKLAGTPFQLRVWQELTLIPHGETITYAELACRIGKPTAVRAVGHANGRNPVSIIVPCHRVIGASGKLTGYGGGVDKKEFLLALECSKQRTRERTALSAGVGS